MVDRSAIVKELTTIGKFISSDKLSGSKSASWDGFPVQPTILSRHFGGLGGTAACSRLDFARVWSSGTGWRFCRLKCQAYVHSPFSSSSSDYLGPDGAELAWAFPSMHTLHNVVDAAHRDSTYIQHLPSRLSLYFTITSGDCMFLLSIHP